MSQSPNNANNRNNANGMPMISASPFIASALRLSLASLFAFANARSISCGVMPSLLAFRGGGFQ